MKVIRPLVAPAGFAVAVVVLVMAGRGDLAAPPVHGFDGWLDDRGPVTAAMAVLRVLALGAAVWMFVASAVGAVARLAGATRLAVAAEQAMPPTLRRALTGLAGAGAAGAALLGAADASTVGAAATAPSALQLVRLPDEPPPQPSTDEPVATATMSVLPTEPAAAAATGWVVEPGDSFWSIAEDVLADAWGRSATDAEIDPYWRSLIDANRDRLVTADPDLIHPGQIFTLPAPPAPPG